MAETDHDLLPVGRRTLNPRMQCIYCGRVRVAERSWVSRARPPDGSVPELFSHGICPQCYAGIVEPSLEEIRQRKRLAQRTAGLKA